MSSFCDFVNDVDRTAVSEGASGFVSPIEEWNSRLRVSRTDRCYHRWRAASAELERVNLQASSLTRVLDPPVFDEIRGWSLEHTQDKP